MEVVLTVILFNCSLNKSLFSLVAISASSSPSGTNSILSPAVAMPQIPSLSHNASASTTSLNGTKTADRTKRVLEAKEIIRAASIVCFDVDSTVIQEEGIFSTVAIKLKIEFNAIANRYR